MPPWLTTDLVVVWLCFFADYVLMTAAIPIFPMLGESDFTTGCLFAMKAAFQIACSPLLTLIVDRIPKTKLVATGLLIETVSLCAFASRFALSAFAVDVPSAASALRS